MRGYIRWILRVTAVAGACLGLLVILLLLAPVLMNLEPVKQRIIDEFSQKIGGTVETQSIDLFFFPRPSIMLHGGRVSIPEKLSGTFSSLSVYPAVLPLLRGNVRISRLALDRPDFQVRLPENRAIEGLKQFSVKTIGEKAASIMAKVASTVPGLVVSIKKGNVTLLTENRPAIAIHNIDAHAAITGKRFRGDIVCASNIWEHASLTGWFETGRARGEGSMQFTRLRPDLIAQNVFPHMVPRIIEDSQVNLKVSLRKDGAGLFRTDLQADVPSATLRDGQRTLTLREVSLKGNVLQQGDKIEASLVQLDSVYPQLRVSGRLDADPASSRWSAELHSSEVDVESLRRTLLFLAGETTIVRSVFETLRNGSVTQLDIASRGRSTDDLTRVENIVMQSRFAGGRICLPEERLYLEDVKGTATISRGTFEGKDIAAHLGGIKGTNGLVRMDLTHEHGPFHVAVTVDADVAELPFYLKRLVKDRTFLRELNAIGEVRGSASAHLILDRRARGISASLDVKSFKLLTTEQSIPYPVEINGKFSYDGPTARVVVEDASGKVGESSFSQLSGRLSLAEESSFRITSGAATISLDEIYPWLPSLESTRDFLEMVDSADGIVKLDAVQAEGPLSRPGSWQFRADGHVKDVTVTSPHFRAPVEAKSGAFEAGPKKLSFSHFDLHSQDSSLIVSGALSHNLEGIERADLSLQGEIGAESNLRLADLLNVPQELRTRAPFSLSRVHVLWEKGGAASLSGDLRVKHGPDVSVDALSRGEELMFKRFAIKDAKSDASLSFHLKGKEMDFSFDGILTGATLDGLLQRNEFLTGRVKGNLSTHIVFDQPFNSTATGMLTGTRLNYPRAPEGPVQIASFSLNAQDKLFTVDSDFRFAEQEMRIKGEVDFARDEFLVDGDLFLKGLDLHRVMTEEAGPKGGSSFWDLPVKGILRIESDYMQYDRFTWRPVRASVLFDTRRISVDIMEANLCGIETLGLLEVSPMGLELYAEPRAKDRDLHETLACLSDTSDIHGRFSFDAEVHGKGSAEESANSLNGTVAIEARNGHIDRYGLLAKIFEVLSPTGIFKLPDLRKRGFSYHTISAMGTVQNGTIVIRHALVDAPSTDLVFDGEIDLIGKKIDAVVLVAPFKTVDRIISHIPLIRYILAGRLVALPVKVTGDLDNPKVVPLPPSAIGASLQETMKRVLHLPVRLIQPLLKGQEQGGS